MVTERIAKKPALLWVGPVGCFLVVILCVGVLVATGFIGNIWFSHTGITITDVVLTTGLDAQGRPVDNVTRFDPSVGRIYCAVTIDAPKPIHLGMRWYYGDTLILDQAQTVDKSGYMSIYRKDGTPFPEGQYRVEIYLAKEPSHTVYFTVGQ